MLDGHIHIMDGTEDREGLVLKLHRAGMEGGILISRPPPAFPGVAPAMPNEQRLENVLWWSQAGPLLYPFYWIDPLEDDAADQVDLAVEQGVAGFKVICGRHDPGHATALAVFRRIAAANRPILFHSGILWDGEPSSSHNRPAAFEALLEVDRLRFAVAHVSWPWCDECIAVYGKFLNAYARRAGMSVEMFIDTAPGTPRIYRREVLTKLFTIGYEVRHNVIFGSDGVVGSYDSGKVSEWVERDRAILAEVGVNEDTVQAVFGGNLKRFVEGSSHPVQKKALVPGE